MAEICTLFILTDTPKTYGDEIYPEGTKAVFVKSIKVMLSHLKATHMAGLILEVDKVMHASRDDRNTLFNYAGVFPILRTKLNPRHGFVAYLDDKKSFFDNLFEAMGKRSRSHERKDVDLACCLAVENDPIITCPVSGAVMDVSQGGCHLVLSDVFPEEQFVHLRIDGLTGARPIFSSVRWTLQDPESGATAMGLMFIDLTDDQLQTIQEL
ncbi:PilZ domain-containing protein [Pseudodesulfovibrio sediminis]|uniref:PilZ domain-containing protein n=1 Tax=Pseudodesulfovibrio sediminis TaxID=2810563 RepID=A0ABN6ET74_9BACT|nr:PilZ domain-containing protein [Pseudodesulfovibrio sediminis]BCS88638.1 hypothetical protein PSDVSF_18800 [Pseudodesulfovibrio sediminis]